MSDQILSFKDLRVYKLAFELQQEIFQISKAFSAEERYALTDQIRRASRSVGANISEAWQKRRYVAHFISKLDGFRRRTSRDTALAEYICSVRVYIKASASIDAQEVLANRSNVGDDDVST
jgi:four helix bundle protein